MTNTLTKKQWSAIQSWVYDTLGRDRFEASIMRAQHGGNEGQALPKPSPKGGYDKEIDQLFYPAGSHIHFAGHSPAYDLTKYSSKQLAWLIKHYEENQYKSNWKTHKYYSRVDDWQDRNYGVRYLWDKPEDYHMFGRVIKHIEGKDYKIVKHKMCLIERAIEKIKKESESRLL